MKIQFEYQDSDQPWKPITLNLDIEAADVTKKLDYLKRQFPDCNLRALDEYHQVLEIRHQDLSHQQT